jgi:hypothetical protein
LLGSAGSALVVGPSRSRGNVGQARELLEPRVSESSCGRQRRCSRGLGSSGELWPRQTGPAVLGSQACRCAGAARSTLKGVDGVDHLDAVDQQQIVASSKAIGGKTPGYETQYWQWLHQRWLLPRAACTAVLIEPLSDSRACQRLLRLAGPWIVRPSRTFGQESRWFVGKRGGSSTWQVALALHELPGVRESQGLLPCHDRLRLVEGLRGETC